MGKHRIAVAKQLILMDGFLVTVILHGVRLCKEHLLSRTLNSYESRLDWDVTSGSINALADSCWIHLRTDIIS